MTPSSREIKWFLGCLCVGGALLFALHPWKADSPPDISGLVEKTPEITVGETGEPREETLYPEETGGEIFVHISGGVKNPGLYPMRQGDRVADALEAAGGLTEDGDVSAVNLAKKLRDEEKIYVPVFGEQPPSSSGGAISGEKINLNTAGVAELQKLPGVGQSTAERIVRFRETNGFSSEEDLKNVPGIGEKRYEELKDLVTY